MMDTQFAQYLQDMTDEELLEELTRPSGNLEFKMYINSIALIRILEKVIEIEKGLLNEKIRAV